MVKIYIFFSVLISLILAHLISVIFAKAAENKKLK